MFQVYASTDQRLPPSKLAAHARRAEALGYTGLNIPEAVHDGLVMAGIALGATTRLKVATSVLVAFPRSPMTLAMAAWDLQAWSGGRFELGIGPQVRGNIVKRYGVEWRAPVPRMREYVASLRAIFASFQQGAPLAVEGEHYRFSRLQPFFNPGPIEQPQIPIGLGAVGPRMTELAGEVADRLVTHPTASAPRVLRELTLPRLVAGARRGERTLDALQLMVAPLVATGVDEAHAREERERQRELLGFLYSTPAYWPSLEVYGWGDIGARLHEHSRAGDWTAMREVVHDEMLEEMVPAAPYPDIARVLRERYEGIATSVTFPMPEDESGDHEVAKVLADLES